MNDLQPQAEKFKEKVRDDWTKGAEAWRKWRIPFVQLTRAATEHLISASQVRPGMTVLDIASGTGEPALSLAKLVGPTGTVTASDLVPEMLAVAQDGARELGLRNVLFEQADAESLAYKDESFDLVTSRFGIMFCPQPNLALAQIRRVLKPQGRAAFLVWGPFESNPYFTTTTGVFMKHVSLPPPPPGAPTPFTFAKLGSLSEVMKAATFRDVIEEQMTIDWNFPGSALQCWDFIREVTGPVFQRFFDALPADKHERVVGEVIDEIGRYVKGDSVNLTANVIIATGIR